MRITHQVKKLCHQYMTCLLLKLSLQTEDVGHELIQMEIATRIFYRTQVSNRGETTLSLGGKLLRDSRSLTLLGPTSSH